MTREGTDKNRGRTGEHLSEDGLSTSAVVTSEVSALKHELEVCRSLG
jgi:hypothetical protein